MRLDNAHPHGAPTQSATENPWDLAMFHAWSHKWPCLVERSSLNGSKPCYKKTS